MRNILLAVLPLAVLAGCATSPAAPVANSLAKAEIGYAPGSLGFAAITDGDWSRAEAQLNKRIGVSEDDPARLLNLAHVYLKTGREADAIRLYQQVAEAEDSDLVLADGTRVSARAVARRMLSRKTSYAALR